MLFPAGKSKLHKGVHPREVLDTVDTGYVRLTVEDEKFGLTDHYVLYQEKKIVGAFCELKDNQLYGKEALDCTLSLDAEALAETVIYSKDTLDRIRKDHPGMFIVFGGREQFRIADTVFSGTLCAVRGGDFLTVLNQLEAEKLTGCLRVSRETEEAIQEGAVLFSETPVAALFESRDSVRLGDDALREITLFYTEGQVYELNKEFIEKFLFQKNASRLKSSVEETISSEKARDDLRRFIALQALGLERGTLVLNSPCNGTFSFEALLKSAASREFDGYLWVRSDNSRGLMVMGLGKVQAAFAQDPSEELLGMKALRKIYESMEFRGTVDFYQLPSTPNVRQSFESEGATDDILVRKLLGEMGRDLMKDVTLAKEFKKQWKTKKEQLGE